MLGRGSIAKKVRIGEVRELTLEELPRLKEKRVKNIVQKFRDSHRKMAWLFASGLTHEEVAEGTGYSLSRVYTLYPTPAFQELIASLRSRVDEVRIESIRDYETLRLANRMKAARQVSDRLDAADEEEETLPVRELVAIMGVGEKNTNVNVNVNLDFAARLDRAVARSNGKLIDHQSLRDVTPLGPPQVASQGAASKLRSAASLEPSRDERQPLPIRRRAFA